jgi:NAD(P)-dependent dehydrogenase (short-subunit alcohol dehydrogenase family)
MLRIFITGSADGLGRLAALRLVGEGHQVVLHARSKERVREAMAAVPGAETALVGDLASLAETKHLAEQADRSGPFDAVIHNAGLGYRAAQRVVTEDGLSQLFAVNTLAPYVLTASMQRPRRLIYLSSGLHRNGDASLDDLNWEQRRWNGMQAYSDTKLHDAMLACAVARRWPEVFSNALEPGWVATKMGGAGAPDDLDAGAETQAWLAVSDDAAALVSGKYFFHLRQQKPHPAVSKVELQDKLLAECARRSGVTFPD